MSEQNVYLLGERKPERNAQTTVYCARTGIEQCAWAFLWVDGNVTRDELADLAVARSRVPVVVASACDSCEEQDTATRLVIYRTGHYIGHCLDRVTALALAAKVVSHAAERVVVAFSTDLAHCLAAAESPAEERLAVALCSELDCLADVTPQVEIAAFGKKYRADFLIGNAEVPDLRLVVEVDGHDFHERTKEQAARDRSRDRAMLAEGLHVMRFTGSEIWNRPGECAREVRRFVEERL